jgi:hypothetical protein
VRDAEKNHEELCTQSFYKMEQRTAVSDITLLQVCTNNVGWEQRVYRDHGGQNNFYVMATALETHAHSQIAEVP